MGPKLGARITMHLCFPASKKYFQILLYFFLGWRRAVYITITQNRGVSRVPRCHQQALTIPQEAAGSAALPGWDFCVSPQQPGSPALRFPQVHPQPREAPDPAVLVEGGGRAGALAVPCQSQEQQQHCHQQSHGPGQGLRELPCAPGVHRILYQHLRRDEDAARAVSQGRVPSRQCPWCCLGSWWKKSTHLMNCIVITSNSCSLAVIWRWVLGHRKDRLCCSVVPCVCLLSFSDQTTQAALSWWMMASSAHCPSSLCSGALLHSAQRNCSVYIWTELSGDCRHLPSLITNEPLARGGDLSPFLHCLIARTIPFYLQISRTRWTLWLARAPFKPGESSPPNTFKNVEQSTLTEGFLPEKRLSERKHSWHTGRWFFRHLVWNLKLPCFVF